jgi:hypothetical protein
MPITMEDEKSKSRLRLERLSRQAIRQVHGLNNALKNANTGENRNSIRAGGQSAEFIQCGANGTPAEQLANVPERSRIVDIPRR